MHSLWHLSLVFTIYLCIYSPVNGLKRCKSKSGPVCDFDDDDCMTLGCNNVFKKMAVGVPGVVEPTDPLYIDELMARIKCFKFQLTNATLTGIKGCTLSHVHVEKKTLVFEKYLYCPKLVINANYEGKGQLGPGNIDGKGTLKWTAMNYAVIFIGKYNIYINKTDDAPHPCIIRQRIATDPRGTINLSVNRIGGKTKESYEALNYVNSNWDIIEEYVQRQIISKFMADLIENHLNKYFKVLRLDQVSPAEKCDRL